MDYQAVHALMDKMKEDGLTLVEVEETGLRIRLEKYPQGRPETAVSAPVPNCADGREAPSVSKDTASGAEAARLQAAESTERIRPAEQGTEGKSPEAEVLREICSPMVGTVYLMPAPEEEPFVSVGDKIKKGQQVCIVEAMKLMNEIESELEGELAEILVENGQMVEYGQPMFRLK